MSKFKLQNTYTVDGDVAYIHMRSKSGEEMDTVIDAEDLERAKKYNWHARLELHSGRYYAMAAKRYRDENGKACGTSIHLHRYIMGMDGKSQKYIVDHIDADDTLNNRKSNLRVTTHANNSSNRKGANKNSNTGVRNVSYIKSANCYYVQMMKNGKRFCWAFPADQFKEACKFAGTKRKELFGEYAGKGTSKDVVLIPEEECDA